MLNQTKTWQEEEQQFINQSSKDINKELSRTWQEEFYKKFNYIQAVKNEQSGNSYNRITDFISDLRKRDMEALIEIMKDKFAPSDNFLTIDLIKDYYEN